MKEKNYIRAGIFYGGLMTLSILAMHKTNLLLVERVSKLEHKFAAHEERYQQNVNKCNRNFHIYNKKIAELMEAVK